KSAAAEKSLGQRDLRKAGITLDHAKGGGTRQHQISRQLVVRRVLREQAAEAGFRSKNFGRQRNVQAVVLAAMRIHGIVAAVLDEGGGEKTHQHLLREQRDQFRSDQRRSQNVDFPECVAVLNGVLTRQSLAQLERSFFAPGRKRAHVV